MLLLWKVILAQVMAAIRTATKGLFRTFLTAARRVYRALAPLRISGILHTFPHSIFGTIEVFHSYRYLFIDSGRQDAGFDSPNCFD